MPVVTPGKILHLPVGKMSKKKKAKTTQAPRTQWTVKRFGTSEFDLTPEMVA